ncbi:MAG: hypothetical protein AAB227_03280 [Pseudomonadota bacterium]
MVRIMECATSRCLLVIPEDSHVFARMAEAREKAGAAAKKRAAKVKSAMAEPMAPRVMVTAS